MTRNTLTSSDGADTKRKTHTRWGNHLFEVDNSFDFVSI